MRECQYDPLILKAPTMIDTENGWFEIVQYNDKNAATISKLVYQECLCIYSSSTIIAYNCGNELLDRAFKKKIKN